MYWSDEIILEFAKIFVKHECIWNPAHPGHNVQDVRKKAYSDIITQFESKTGIVLTRTELNLKICYLRERYRKEITKIFRHSCPGFTYESPSSWFQLLDRCYKSIPGQQDSVMYPQKLPSTNQTLADCEHQPSNNLEEVHPEPLPLITQTISEYDENRHEECTMKTEEHQSQLQSQPNLGSESVLEEDEFDIFGKLLATQLRKLSTEKGLRLQLEIQNLISEARLSDLQNQ